MSVARDCWQDKVARLNGIISELRAQLQRALETSTSLSADAAKKATSIERLQHENEQLKTAYVTKSIPP